jgi:hypothetical protein
MISVCARCVLAEDAVVLDAFDPGGFCLGDGFIVLHAILQPEIGDVETNHIIDDRRNVFGGAEDIDEIDLAAFYSDSRHSVFQSGVACEDFAVDDDFAQRRVDGDHPITVPYEVVGDVVAGAPGLVADADNGDGLGIFQHFIDDGAAVFAHGLLFSV